MTPPDLDPPQPCDCPAFAPGLTFHLVTDHADDCGYDIDDPDHCETCWGCHAGRATSFMATFGQGGDQ